MRPYFDGVTVGTLIGVPQIMSTQRIREKKISSIFSISAWLRRYRRLSLPVGVHWMVRRFVVQSVKQIKEDKQLM